MTNPNKSDVEKLIYKTFDILDKTGNNTRKYKDMFGKMSEAEFHKMMKQFLDDDESNFYLEVKAFENEPTLKDVKKASEFLGIELEEYVYMPYVTGDADNPVRTMQKCFVGYLHMKRLQQLLQKKNSSSIEIEQRNAKSGQVQNEDKNARVSDSETFALSVIEADNALKEFMGCRSDSMNAKSRMLNKINTQGYVSLEDVKTGIEDKQALNTLDVFFLGCGIVTDLITPGLALRGTLDSKKVKEKIDNKYVDKERLK